MTVGISLLVFTVIVALVFDLINGFHDAANSIATIVSTRVLRPQLAVLWAAFFNFIAMFIFSPKVADTISQIVRVEANDPEYIVVILCGLLGAVTWNLITWWFGLPTSSSHSLIGGLAGAGVSYGGWQALRWEKLIVTIEFIVLAPLIGLLLGGFFMILVAWLFRRWRPAIVDRHFRKGQLLSAALYSIGHGGNDAQKTMGIILAVLLAAGHIPIDSKLSLTNADTLWIILACQAAMALGTAMGGWRIVKTMGMKITKLKPVGGFCAETAGACTLFAATYGGIPVSTTHTITGAIIGVGSTNNKFSSVRWGMAQRIVWAWVMTIPAAGLVAAACLWIALLIQQYI